MKKAVVVLCGMLAAQASIASEESLYDFLWLDPDKSVYVLQNKLYPKEGRFFVDVGYVSTQTSTFQNTNGLQLKATYFFHEEWGIETFWLGYSSTKNEAFRNVQVVNNSEPFVRRQEQTLGIGAVWSPFYGKINTFNKIFYFDWSFSAGIAQVTTESNLKSVTDPNNPSRYDSEHNLGGYGRTTLRFHINRQWSVGVEYLGTYYQAPGPKNPKSDRWRSNYDLAVQLGWSY